MIGVGRLSAKQLKKVRIHEIVILDSCKENSVFLIDIVKYMQIADIYFDIVKVKHISHEENDRSSKTIRKTI